MKITVGSANIPLTDSLDSFAREQIDLASHRSQDRIRNIRIRLGVERRRTGRSIERCLLVVTMDNGSRIVIREKREDLYMAITQACRRMKVALDKQRKRKLSQRNRWAIQTRPRPALGM